MNEMLHMSTERLDELLGMASEAGYMRAKLEAAEKAHEGARDKSYTYPALRQARKDSKLADARLANARERTLSTK